MRNPDYSVKIERGVAEALTGLELEVVSCRMCPRLVNFREHVAREKRRRYTDWNIGESQLLDLETLGHAS